MDDIDKQIISELIGNGRESLRKIAKKLNLSHTAIAKRYELLVAKNEAKSTCLVNTTALGITCYIILISAINKKSIVKKAKECSFIREIFETLGEYNIGFIMGSHSVEELDEHLECFLKSDNIKKYRTIPMICKDNFIPIKTFHGCSVCKEK